MGGMALLTQKNLKKILNSMSHGRWYLLVLQMVSIGTADGTQMRFEADLPSLPPTMSFSPEKLEGF